MVCGGGMEWMHGEGQKLLVGGIVGLAGVEDSRGKKVDLFCHEVWWWVHVAGHGQ
jgi:hypothetical protein